MNIKMRLSNNKKLDGLFFVYNNPGQFVKTALSHFRRFLWAYLF